MIFVAKNADFSANSIGKININTELSSFTKNLLKKMTRFDEKSDEAFAFDMFYSSLVDKGLWSKINNLYLPVMAKDIGETFCDIAGDLNYDVIDFSESNIELSELNGLRQIHKSGGGINDKIRPLLNGSVNFNDVSACMYLLDNFQEKWEEGYTYDAKRNIGFTNQLSYFSLEVGGDGMIYPSTMIASGGSYPSASGSTNAALVPQKGFFGFTRRTSDGYDTEYVVDGEAYEYGDKQVGDETNVTNMQFFAENFKSGRKSGNAPQKTIIAPSVGMYIVTRNALSRQEMLDFESIVNAFMASFVE